MYVDLLVQHANSSRPGFVELSDLVHEPDSPLTPSAALSNGSDDEDLVVPLKRKQTVRYDCSECAILFDSAEDAEEHVVKTDCQGIVGRLSRMRYRCPCNAFEADTVDLLRTHKEHCQGYGELRPVQPTTDTVDDTDADGMEEATVGVSGRYTKVPEIPFLITVVCRRLNRPQLA